MNPTTNDYVQAFSPSNTDIESPNQAPMDEYWKMLSAQATVVPPAPIYNFQTTQISKPQRFLIFFAAAGVAYLIYKQIKRG